MIDSKPTIQLYSYPTSPYAEKVGCYLKYKRLDFELVPVNPIYNKELRFTHQKQVPVLKIGDEWRKESSELGLWLDELFPERPIMPSDQSARAEVMRVDQWVSESLIPTKFRGALEWEKVSYGFHNGWTLARAVSDATPLPWYIRLIWPLAVRRAGFIVHMVNRTDLDESMKDRVYRMRKEFVEHLNGGAFFAGQSTPTLADLSAYPTIVSGHLLGMKSDRPFSEDRVILDWCRRVQSHLPKNPLLVPDHLIVRDHL